MKGAEEKGDERKKKEQKRIAGILFLSILISIEFDNQIFCYADYQFLRKSVYVIFIWS